MHFQRAIFVLYKDPFLRKPYLLIEDDKPKMIVIDPLISFGNPVLVSQGIPTRVIAERFKAGEKIDEIAVDYDVSNGEVEEAIRFKHRSRRGGNS